MVLKFLSLILFAAMCLVNDSSAFMKDIPDHESVQKRINERYDDLFNEDVDGRLIPYVCCVCDELIMTKDDLQLLPQKQMKKARDLLLWDWLPAIERIPAVEEEYTFTSELNPGKPQPEWLKGMALSPRGSLKKPSPRHGFSFTCCSECSMSLRQNKVPTNAIVNRNFVGCAPECIRELTDIELAFISPIKSYGYCFVYEGGQGRCVKGTLVFMRVKERQVAKSAMTLDCMGLNNHVVVLVSGKLTKDQQKRIKTKSQIRTSKVIKAVEWLCANHKEWKKVDLEALKEEIKNGEPIVVEKSSTCESTNVNVEKEEVFTCYYPDGTTNGNAGGFDTPGAFKEFVKEMQEKNYDIELKSEIEKEFVKGGDDEVLMGGALVQFPYGVGGIYESRRTSKGQLTNKTNLTDYLKHLSKKSAPEFQTPLFQLILFSLKSKAALLRSSRLNLKSKQDATTIAQGFDAGNLSAAIRGRRAGSYAAGGKVSQKVLDAVDATSRALPHTKDAAKRARSNVEAMQHYFGSGAVFLTVTLDDENSILMQVLSDERVDFDDKEIRDLTDDELAERAQKRQNIRFKYPGVAAMNFEILLDIVISEVIGWDTRDNCSNGKKGLFGKVKAMVMAIEEQGRKTLHAHIILWIQGYDDLKKQLFFGSELAKRKATTELQKYHEHIASTSLFPTENRLQQVAFDHEGCTVQKFEREPPIIVPPQQLRYLRHKVGCKEEKGLFAECAHCPKTWTYETLGSSYMMNVEGVQDKVSTIRDEDKAVSRARMMAEIVNFQKPNSGEECPEACINMAYQSHASCHAKSCFKCNKLTGKKRKEHTCGPNCECRYRLPDKKRRRTTIKVENEGIPWFAWDGSKTAQPLLQVLPKRNPMDLFQNVCCKCISCSKLSCNTNVALIMDGPIAYYICKYCVKANDKDEVAEYTEVDATMKKVTGRVHEENDRAEALRIICRAAFAHNKENVVSATLASFLLRNDSRFYFSHEFKFCPLKDVVRLHNKQDVDGTLRIGLNGHNYFENQALHYLCRPKQLENVSLKTFFEEYEIAFTSSRKCKDNPVLPMLFDTGFYKHPSGTERTDRKGNRTEKVAQGVRNSKENFFVKVPQWLFPDTAEFNNNILTCADDEINRAMDTFAQAVLSFLLPHRSSADLKVQQVCDFPYAMKLREVHASDEVRVMNGNSPLLFTEENTTFLQNIQNACRNSIRYKITKDDLQSCTEPYIPEGVEVDLDDSDEENEDDDDVFGYEDFLNELGGGTEPPAHDNDPDFFFTGMKNFSFKNIRNNGDNGCGYAKDVGVIDVDTTGAEFVQFTPTHSNPGNTQNPDVQEQPRTYGVKRMVEILLRKTTVSSKNVWQDINIDVSDANGTIRSIREWAKAGFGKDRKQQRAFETIIAAFLLTFYEDRHTTSESDLDPTVTRQNHIRYRRARRNLLKLKGNVNDDQLICLLHGPGGSGKSTVINMVKAYAKSFCESIGHEYTYRTIVTTACSGVAATLLHGETSTLAMHLAKAEPPKKDIPNWKDTRLVIIDEISFACPDEFDKMHDRLKVLMQKRYKLFGGVNIVFAGDYSQLEPVNKPNTVFSVEDMYTFHHAINCFVELDGTHRFKLDPEWGRRLFRFRTGNPTSRDIDVINDACLVRNKKPPAKIQYATFANKNRDAINSSVFEDWCAANRPTDGSVLENAVLVLMDNLQMTDSQKKYVNITSNSVKRHFYENSSENDCKMPESQRGRVDPMLKLYPNCPMMFTQNLDVINGKANGSRLLVKSIKVKPGEDANIVQLDCGTKIRCFYVHQIQHIVVEHESPDVEPRQFNAEPKSWEFYTNLEIGLDSLRVKMKGSQFPLISNSATTGHKLQGCTVTELMVNDWHYKKNWAYVVLSRVKTMDGLYLRQPLSYDLKKYSKNPKMTKMLENFRNKCAMEDMEEHEYDVMINAEDEVQ